MRKKVSTSSIHMWLKGCIIVAYKTRRLEPPVGITAHSLQSTATFEAYRAFPFADVICKAVTWETGHSFMQH